MNDSNTNTSSLFSDLDLNMTLTLLILHLAFQDIFIKLFPYKFEIIKKKIVLLSSNFNFNLD